ncbi:hypothetical protein DV515_00012909 [Chloebia gouldiae]|uniref:Uncharacterized protein n=1 Tax=Chloebia gouldiae TaxID=44316 RepID=A0A3L8S2D1_CHLGU|nr:hypothetical protein DV515_00012909 [Chloebia gouldiae]
MIGEYVTSGKWIRGYQLLRMKELPKNKTATAQATQTSAITAPSHYWRQDSQKPAPEELLLAHTALCGALHGSPLPMTEGSRSTKTARGTCFPAPVSLKKVLKESSPPPMLLSLGMLPSGWMPCSRQYSSQQALPICTPACPTWMEMHSRCGTETHHSAQTRPPLFSNGSAHPGDCQRAKPLKHCPYCLGCAPAEGHWPVLPLPFQQLQTQSLAALTAGLQPPSSLMALLNQPLGPLHSPARCSRSSCTCLRLMESQVS